MAAYPFSRRGLIRIVSYLAAAFLILCGLVISKHNETTRYQRYLAVAQLHAFDELSTNLGEIDAALQKASYATSPSMISALCTQVYGKAQAAQMSMGELPYSNVELEQTAAFIARVGDYAYAVAKSAGRNGGWTQQETADWDALSQRASALSDQLAQLESEIQAGAATLETVDQAEARLARADGESGSNNSLYQDIESEFSELPTLIYDGPFSQHLDGRTALALEGLAEISQEEAQRTAADFLGITPEQLELVSQMDGSLPAWLFSTGDGKTIEISRAGGVVVQFFSGVQNVVPTLTQQEGVEKAIEFLSDHGYDNMRESYYIQQEGILTVNFAYTQEDVICYPDLVKVSVSLEDGSITAFEARGYLTNHAQRQLEEPALSPEEVAEKLPEKVTQLSCQLAVVPTAGEYERLCYEIKGQSPEGQHVIYYFNAQDGAEEQIFILLESEDGTLVL